MVVTRKALAVGGVLLGASLLLLGCATLLGHGGGESVLVSEGRGRMFEKLENVFTAPMQAFQNVLGDDLDLSLTPSSSSSPSTSGSPDTVVDADQLSLALKPQSVAPGTKMEVDAGGHPMEVTVLTEPDADGLVKVSGFRGDIEYTGRVKLSAPAPALQCLLCPPPAFPPPGKSDSPLSGRSGGDYKIVSVGPLTPTGYRKNYGHMSAHKAHLPLPTQPVSHWFSYDYPKSGTGEISASMRIDAVQPTGCDGTPCNPPKAKAHLKIDVYCPPYVAPDHGSVWYKGVEHREVTAVTPFDREFFNIGGGKKLPVAQEGDIPEGEHVQITCDEHWQLTAKGKEFPKCLNTGEFEKGKECEPIMCSQYNPPEHGGVYPPTPVQAGTRVTIFCYEGWAEDYWGSDQRDRKSVV